MKLYGSYTSPFVRHCRVALAQEGLYCDFIETDLSAIIEKSPVAKMPLLTDGDLTLTDSSSILKYIREKSGGRFLADLQDYENFALTNTVLDSMVNVFLLENEGFGAEQIRYVGRQKNRIANGLAALNRRFDPSEGIVRDSALRCACFIDWALFRNRISNLEQWDNLRGLLAGANQSEVFVPTAPPR